MLFTCKGNGLRICFPSNTENDNIFVDLYLLKKWAFQNTLLSVEDVVTKVSKSDKGVPTANEASAWSVPEALKFGQAKTKLDFEVAHKVPVTCWWGHIFKPVYNTSLGFYVGERIGLRGR
jgi:hypothetical protein